LEGISLQTLKDVLFFFFGIRPTMSGLENICETLQCSHAIWTVEAGKKKKKKVNPIVRVASLLMLTAAHDGIVWLEAVVAAIFSSSLWRSTVSVFPSLFLFLFVLPLFCFFHFLSFSLFFFFLYFTLFFSLCFSSLFYFLPSLFHFFFPFSPISCLSLFYSCFVLFLPSSSFYLFPVLLLSPISLFFSSFFVLLSPSIDKGEKGRESYYPCPVIM